MKTKAAQTQRVRHLRIRMGALILDYTAPATQVDDVAKMLTGCHPGLEITVDDDVRAEHPPLPCSELWD